MKSSKIPLPISGGTIAKAVLRNRGRLRNAISKHLFKKLEMAAQNFLNDKWIPLVAPNSSHYSISLTSWGPRLNLLSITLLTLLQQSVTPKEIVVWLTKNDLKALPDQVPEKFLPFSVRFECCDDLGPHKKWLPMLELGTRNPFVICDDDIIYPYRWFEKLTSEDRDDAYVGLRCHQIKYAKSGYVLPYSQWLLDVASARLPSFDLFVTGGAGAIIHPDRISAEFRHRGTIFDKCPKADDIWLKAAHSASGIPCCKTKYSFPCLEIPGSFDSGLLQSNVDNGGNDQQILSFQKLLKLKK